MAQIFENGTRGRFRGQTAHSGEVWDFRPFIPGIYQLINTFGN